MITINQLAKRLMLSKATVSRALQNQAYVAPDTKKRVLRAAKKYGYEPSAAMSAAMSAAGSRGRLQYKETLGVLSVLASLDDHHGEVKTLPDYSRRQAFFSGLQSRSAEVGCALDYFVLPENNPDSLMKVLETRGIHRLMIMPGMGQSITRSRFVIETITKRFPTILLGATELNWHMDLPICQADLYLAGRQAFLRAWQAGYQRLLVASLFREMNLEGRFVAGLVEGCRASQASVDIQVLENRNNGFPAEYSAAGPETCIIAGLSRAILTEIEALLSRPDAPGWIDWHANLNPNLGFAGIDQRDEEQGSACVDACLGLPSDGSGNLLVSPNFMIVPGWIQGKSLKIVRQAHDGLDRCRKFPASAGETYFALPLPERMRCPKQAIRERVFPYEMAFPRDGASSYHHIPFNIPRGLPMVLTPVKGHSRMRRSTRFPCARRASALYFLHSLIGCMTERTLGYYTIVYASGRREHLPINAADAYRTVNTSPIPNIRDWWARHGSVLETESTFPVLLIDTEGSTNLPGYLSLHRWENPHPHEQIEQIQMACSGGGSFSILLFGITVAN